jgi:hypothetical protein
MGQETPKNDWNDHWNLYTGMVIRHFAQEMHHTLVADSLRQNPRAGECHRSLEYQGPRLAVATKLDGGAAACDHGDAYRD